MRDLIYREDVLRGLDGMFPAEAKSEYQHGIATGLALARVRIVSMPSVEPKSEWNNHTVACLLADMFGDLGACNFNGIDEWLPEKCDFRDTECPRPIGVACWEQFLKYREKNK